MTQAFHLARSMKHLSPYDMGRPEDCTYSNFHNCARDAEPALKVMALALDHPLVCTPVRSLAAVTVPDGAQIRALERVSSGAADYYAISGNPGRAMSIRLNGLELGVALPRGGAAIPELVGIACEGMAARGIEPLIPELSDVELRLSAAKMDRIVARRARYSEIVRETGYEQTATIQEALAQVGKTGNRFTQAQSFVESNSDDADTGRLPKMRIAVRSLRFMMGNKRAMIEENERWFQSIATEVGRPYSARLNTPPPTNMIASILFFPPHSMWAMHTAMEAQAEVLRAEIALYRYHKEHRRFPHSLSELCPELLFSVPSEPCSGIAQAQLRYRLRPDGSFLLYGIGTDMKDDGGMPAKHVSDTGGDMVAGKLYDYKPILYTGIANTN